jgi:hypothetical protein
LDLKEEDGLQRTTNHNHSDILRHLDKEYPLNKRLRTIISTETSIPTLKTTRRTDRYIPAVSMCVTNVYVDQYPDGKQVEFRQTSYCQYGQPLAGRPCQKLSTLENPVRKIQFGEPTTEYMMTAHQRVFTHTPPRSSGGSHHRYSGGESTSSEGHRRHSKRRSELFTLKPTRQHKKERIIIVDSPPTPRTPPQVYRETFTAPSSPASPFIIEDLPRRERGHPIIVDERPLHRVDSLGAVVGRRARSQSRSRFHWDSPSSSHTSFDSRARREAEEIQLLEERRRREERDERIAYLEAERRREERIRQQDEEIRRRPPIPFPPAPLRQRQFLRPVIDQTRALLGGLSLDDRAGERVLIAEAENRRLTEERDRATRARLVAEEGEAMKQRLRERQMPKRRFSVGPGGRRHRVVYDNGVYRWE